MTPRIATAGLIAAVCAAASASAAHGGSYHVYGCRTPAGEAAPADGWTGSKTGGSSVAEDTCAEPRGGLVAGLRDFTARTANTDSATAAFAAPPAPTIANS